MPAPEIGKTGLYWIVQEALTTFLNMHKPIKLTSFASQPPIVDPLTPREGDVLQLVAQGLNNQEIADKLFISEATVRSHVSNILSKLHLASRTQAALYALREDYAKLND